MPQKEFRRKPLRILIRPKKKNLFLIPAINKIDLPTANIQEVKKDLIEMFGFKEEEIYYVSAKTGKTPKNCLKRLSKKSLHPKFRKMRRFAL